MQWSLILYLQIMHFSWLYAFFVHCLSNTLRTVLTLEPVLRFPQVCVFHEFVFHSVNSRQQKFRQFYADIFVFQDMQRNTRSVLLILRACLCNVGIYLLMECLYILWLRWLSLRQTDIIHMLLCLMYKHDNQLIIFGLKCA
jgi:hypothetical protein